MAGKPHTVEVDRTGAIALKLSARSKWTGNRCVWVDNMGVGRDVLTDGVELCIECTRHCHGSSFPKLADQAHKSRY